MSGARKNGCHVVRLAASELFEVAKQRREELIECLQASRVRWSPLHSALPRRRLRTMRSGLPQAQEALVSRPRSRLRKHQTDEAFLTVNTRMTMAFATHLPPAPKRRLVRRVGPLAALNESVAYHLEPPSVVTQSCQCGHLQQRATCGACEANPVSKEKTLLKCVAECAQRQRNARLAEALGITPTEKQIEYPAELKSFATQNHAFVITVEKAFNDFFMGPKQAMVLPQAAMVKRQFILGLAEMYRFGTELVDADPHRRWSRCRVWVGFGG